MGRSEMGGIWGGISDLQYPFMHRKPSGHDGKSTPQRILSTNPSRELGTIYK